MYLCYLFNIDNLKYNLTKFLLLLQFKFFGAFCITY
jgi:hypothetical protein